MTGEEDEQEEEEKVPDGNIREPLYIVLGNRPTATRTVSSGYGQLIWWLPVLE
jgi:hypothetical protein